MVHKDVVLDEVTIRISNGLEIRISLATQTCVLWRPLGQPVTLTTDELVEVLTRVLEAKRKEAASGG